MLCVECLSWITWISSHHKPTRQVLYCSHFMEWVTEAQRSETICPECWVGGTSVIQASWDQVLPLECCRHFRRLNTRHQRCSSWRIRFMGLQSFRQFEELDSWDFTDGLDLNMSCVAPLSEMQFPNRIAMKDKWNNTWEMSLNTEAGSE